MDNEELVARIQSGDNKTENLLRLWQQNKGFIATVARKYTAGAEMEDLEQEGYITLCEAVPHYDPDRGASFISYASFWIKRRMRACVNDNRLIHLSYDAGDKVRKYQKIMRQYQQANGCAPSDRELCALLRISQEKLDQIKAAAQMGRIGSLDEPVKGADDLVIGDMVPSGEDMEGNIIRALDRERMSEDLWAAVDGLPGKLPDAVRLKYKDGLTLERTGQALGVSIEYARQLENKAMRILRQPSRCKKLKSYFDEYLSRGSIHHVGALRFNETWTSEVENEVFKLLDIELQMVGLSTSCLPPANNG